MSKSWADEADGDMRGFKAERIESQSSDGREIVKVVTEFRTDEQGAKIKVSTRIRVTRKTVKVHKKVKERRGWTKFGKSAGSGAGLEIGVTSFGEEVFLEAPTTVKSEIEKGVGGVAMQVICRKCGGEHWTRKCPLGDDVAVGVLNEKATTNDDDFGALLSGVGRTGSGSTSTPTDSSSERKPGSYVPPHLRDGKGGGSGDRDRGGDRDRDRDRDEKASVRVTNLSEDVREGDVQDLFRPFGPIARVSLPKDRNTGLPRGFAFVDFYRQEDAARAIEKLHGTGFDCLILNVEWAR